MKTKSFLTFICLLLMNLSIASAEEEMARIQKNMGDTVKIQLISTDSGSSNSKLKVRTVAKDGAVKEVDITQFQFSVREMLMNILNADENPIIEKKAKFVCFMMPHPTPELLVNRISEKTKSTSMEVTLTNVSCAYGSWLAPESPEGEASARILYRFIQEAASSIMF